MAKVDSFATEDSGLDISLPTDADLSAKQYHVVKRDATDGKAVAAGANDKSLGLLQNAPNGSSEDKVAKVRVSGISKGVINEPVTFGQFLTPMSTGKLEVCDAAHEEYIGIALSDGAAQGDIIPVLLQHGEVTATDA